jgi:Ala-tRNA(Pro) deacylase
MKCKQHLETYFRENHTSFLTQHHPIAYTAQEIAASEHVPGKMVVKVVMVMADGNLVMLAVPAPAHVNFMKAQNVLHAKEVRLAKEEEFGGAFPDSEVGAMPPFGNLYNLPVYVDDKLTEDDRIVMQTGTPTDTLSMKFADFERLVKPKVADLTGPR